VIISYRRGSLFTLSVTYDLLRDKKDKKTKEEAK